MTAKMNLKNILLSKRSYCNPKILCIRSIRTNETNLYLEKAEQCLHKPEEWNMRDKDNWGKKIYGTIEMLYNHY